MVKAYDRVGWRACFTELDLRTNELYDAMTVEWDEAELVPVCWCSGLRRGGKRAQLSIGNQKPTMNKPRYMCFKISASRACGRRVWRLARPRLAPPAGPGPGPAARARRRRGARPVRVCFFQSLYLAGHCLGPPKSCRDNTTVNNIILAHFWPGGAPLAVARGAARAGNWVRGYALYPTATAQCRAS